MKGDVCDTDWWKTAELSHLETLASSENPFPEFCDTSNNTPLHRGVLECQNADVISAFIEKTNANVLAGNLHEQTPLNLAQYRLESTQTAVGYAREIYVNATREATRAMTSGAMRHLRRGLNQLATEARENMQQAIREAETAEAIYHTLLSKSQQ